VIPVLRARLVLKVLLAPRGLLVHKASAERRESPVLRDPPVLKASAERRGTRAIPGNLV
jgi:hypothetical protein